MESVALSVRVVLAEKLQTSRQLVLLLDPGVRNFQKVAVLGPGYER